MGADATTARMGGPHNRAVVASAPHHETPTSAASAESADHPNAFPND